MSGPYDDDSEDNLNQFSEMDEAADLALAISEARAEYALGIDDKEHWAILWDQGSEQTPGLAPPREG